MKEIMAQFTPRRTVPFITWRTTLAVPVALIAVWAESTYLDALVPWITTLITALAITFFVVIEWMTRVTAPSPSESYVNGIVLDILLIRLFGPVEPIDELKKIANRLFLKSKGHCVFNERELCVFLDLYKQATKQQLTLPTHELSDVQMREGRRYLKILRPKIGDPDVLEQLVYGYVLIGFLFTALNVDSKQDILSELKITTSEFYNKLNSIHEGSLEHWPSV